MQKTPKSLRLHIAILGRTNVGKSTFLNLLAGQDVAITAPEPGTTTDVVEKTMELLPIGPVVFLDTAGLDDATTLAERRLEKTARVFDRADVVLLICERTEPGEYEERILERARESNLPVIRVFNKVDLGSAPDGFDIVCSARDGTQRDRVLKSLKAKLIEICPSDFITPPPLIGDLLPAQGLVVLIVPIDLEAPKGRIILPQVQTIRDALDHDAASLVVKESNYLATLEKLKSPPDLVVCDSQVVHRMVAETPPEITCTTFSILMARLKGDLVQFARGAAAIEELSPGDAILIAESCSHHALEDDIGRVKIPRWLQEYRGIDLQVNTCAGRDFPSDLGDYSLVVQCGGCMQNRREMLARIQKCDRADIPITNYGICISLTQGVLERVLSPFPDALTAFRSHPSKTEGSP